MSIKKILGSLIILTFAVFVFSGKVYAAPALMDDGNYFDAAYYASTYPDVAAVFGTDPAMLYMHYLLCGQAEGRLPYAPGTVISPAGQLQPFGINTAQLNLDVFSALIGHGEVFENGVIVQQSPGYVKIETPRYWYTFSGGSVNVYKDESVLFDAGAYALLNPDVAAIYGTSKNALWNHYKTAGVFEGRQALGTTLNANAKLMIIQVASAITTPAMTPAEKILAVHDWMVNYASYDQSYMDVSQTLEGFIYNRTAVCKGYADTFDYFMTVLGIPCQVVEGWAGGDHAWNRVAIGGQWFYVDVTWDDPIYRVNGVRRDYLSHEYFMINEAQISADHTAVSYHDYY